MISPERFTEKLLELGVDFFAGVPDSLLKEFCAYIEDKYPNQKHVITANEGSALALATGYQLASNKIPLIYLQNSGFGNAINPLISLMDKKVYSIPALILIGWRGEPGKKDEPQHLKQGEVTIPLIKSMGIPFFVLENNEFNILKAVENAINITKNVNSPVILLAKKGIFSTYKKRNEIIDPKFKNLLSREKAISLIISTLPENSIFISSTGYISRELYELREMLNLKHHTDFLTVGSMGHASQIALGIALFKKNVPIVCLDGDGSMIMHMGGLVTNGQYGTKNFFHILLNNSVHDSVGGQPTSGFEISSTEIAKGCKYKNIFGPSLSESDIKNDLKKMIKSRGPCFLEIRIKPGARENLGRPKESLNESKAFFKINLDSVK